MAEWRAIHKKITTAWDVAQLDRLGKILFTWGVVCADNYGILEDDLGAIKLSILGGDPCGLDEIEAELRHMETLGLIWRYATKERTRLLQFRCFDDYQPKEIVRKRGKSKWPVHWDWQAPDEQDKQRMPEKARKVWTIPEKAPREKERETERLREKEVERPAATAEALFSNLFMDIVGVLVNTKVQQEEIDAFMGEIPEDWFRAACKEAVDKNARNWAYVRAICKRCRDEGKAPGEGKRGKSRGHPQSDALAASRAEIDRIIEERQAEREAEYVNHA